MNPNTTSDTPADGWARILNLATFRVVLAGGTNEGLCAAAAGFGLFVRPLDALSAEHKQVQVVVGTGSAPGGVYPYLQYLLPPLLDGLTFRDLRTGQVMLIPHGEADLAERIGERLHAEVLVLLAGDVPAGSFAARLVYRLADPAVQQQAAVFSGDPAIRFEHTLIPVNLGDEVSLVAASGAILDKVCQIRSEQAAGARLQAIHDKMDTQGERPA